MQDHDLLPHLLRKPGADALDIAYHIGDRLIIKALPNSTATFEISDRISEQWSR